MPRRKREQETGALPEGAAAQQGADFAMRNAERLFASAELLAQSSDYATGCTLLVLACEEAEKAYLLGMLAIGADPTILGAEQILTGHRPRHMRTKVNNLALVMTDGAIAHLAEARRLESDGTLPDPSEMRRRFIQAVTEDAAKYAPGTPGAKQLKESQEWLSNANALKQRGLYVDWNERGWSTPESVTRDNFETGVTVVSHVIGSRRSLLDSLRAMRDEDRAALVEAMSAAQKKFTSMFPPKAG